MAHVEQRWAWMELKQGQHENDVKYIGLPAVPGRVFTVIEYALRSTMPMELSASSLPSVTVLSTRDMPYATIFGK